MKEWRRTVILNGYKSKLHIKKHTNPENGETMFIGSGYSNGFIAPKEYITHIGEIIVYNIESKTDKSGFHGSTFKVAMFEKPKIYF